MIKKALFTFFLGFSLLQNLNGENLNNLNLTSEYITAAIGVYNTEIKLLEENYSPNSCKAKKLLSMYRERADLNFAKKSYLAALRDYQKVVSFTEDAVFEKSSDFLSGICGCLFCYQCLDEEESAKHEFNKLVHNVALLGESIESVDWIRDSEIYPILQNNSRLHREGIILADLPDMTPEEFCQFQCAGYAVAAASACLKVPNVAIATLCGGCIWALEQVCSRCCKGAGFWENCVKPLRRLFHDPAHPENPAPHPFE